MTRRPVETRPGHRQGDVKKTFCFFTLAGLFVALGAGSVRAALQAAPDFPRYGTPEEIERRGKVDAAPALVDQIAKSDADYAAGRSAGQILSGWNVPELSPRLHELLAAGTRRVRFNSAVALLNTDAPTALMVLKELVMPPSGSDEDVTRDARLKLYALARPDLVPTYIKILINGGPYAADVGPIGVLARLHATEAAQALLSIIDGKNEYLRTAAIAGVEVMNDSILTRAVAATLSRTTLPISDIASTRGDLAWFLDKGEMSFGKSTGALARELTSLRPAAAPTQVVAIDRWLQVLGGPGAPKNDPVIERLESLKAACDRWTGEEALINEPQEQISAGAEKDCGVFHQALHEALREYPTDQELAEYARDIDAEH